MSVIRVGAVVTPSSGPASGVLVGDVVAVFDGGVSVAVAWRKDGPVMQYNVGACWLRIREGGPGRDLADALLPRGMCSGRRCVHP